MKNAAPTDKPRRRRWRRFSLRTLFVVFTVVSIWLGTTITKAKRQAAAVAWVRSVGGYVHYDYHLGADGDYDFGRKSALPTWLVQFTGEDWWHRVIVVSINEPLNADTDCSQLGAFNDLKVLSLSNSWIREEQIDHVGSLEELEWFEANDAQISNRLLARLAKSTRLAECHLERTNVTDEGLQVLCDSDSLRTLYRSQFLGIGDVREVLGKLRAGGPGPKELNRCRGSRTLT